MKTNKINWISILQGWAMFLVVLGHCSIWTEIKWGMDFCYGVHMPLFMFVSGGLFYITRIKKCWKWNDVAVDKLKRLGVPYLFFIAFAFGLKVLMASKVKNGVDVSLMGFLQGYVFPMNSAMKEMWFVAALFLIMMAYPLYKWSLKSLSTAVPVLIVALAMPYFFTSYVGGGILNWQGAIRYFAFFYAGILCFKYDVVNRLKMNFGGYLLIFGYLLICMYRKEHTVPVAFVGIAGLVWMCKRLSEKIPSVLSSFRDYSFQIFLLGIYPQMFVELILMKKMTELWMQPLLVVLSVLLGIYVPVIISKSVKRLNNRYFNMILGLK